MKMAICWSIQLRVRCEQASSLSDVCVDLFTNQRMTPLDTYPYHLMILSITVQDA
jgi:hypothetical protein